MEFFCYHRDRPGSKPLREELLEQHWSYMDQYRDFPGVLANGDRYLVLGLGTGSAADITVPPRRDGLIAYGPLLSDDGIAWLGMAVLAQAPDPDAT